MVSLTKVIFAEGVELVVQWQPFSVLQVRKLLNALPCPWWIAGGWAIDQFVGRQTRSHEDIDVLLCRKDQFKLQAFLSDWDLRISDPQGNLRRWGDGEFLLAGAHDIWARPSFDEPWRIQFMIMDTEGDDWIYRRDTQIRDHLSSMSFSSADGVDYLSPEVQLLYKSKNVRPKDQMDFDNVLPRMNLSQRRWLSRSLSVAYPERHPWLSRLEEFGC